MELEDCDGNVHSARWFRKHRRTPYRVDGLTRAQWRKRDAYERREVERERMKEREDE